MSLFSPLWKTQKPEKKEEAADAVRQISDPRKLQEIAMDAYFPEVRLAAVSRISDPRILEEIILAPTSDYELRRETVRRIDDQRILTDIAMQRQAYPADGDAITRITDQVLLKRIALAEQGGEQDKAVYRITDQHMLAEIAIHAKKGSARKTAIRSISDPDILMDIMTASDEGYTRTEAHTRMKNLTVPEGKLVLTDLQHERCMEIITSEPDRNVHIDLSAFKYAADLNRIYRNAVRWDLKAAALSYLVLNEDYAPENLLAHWKDAEAQRKTIHNTYSNPWKDAQESIEDRLGMEEINDPGLLLGFVSDPEVGSSFAADCVKSLFDAQFDPYEEIGPLRDEAFAAYIRNIPAYANQDGNSLKEHLLRLTEAIPAELHDRYGLSVFAEEYGPKKAE